MTDTNKQRGAWTALEQCAEYIGKANAELLSMYVNHCLEVELEDGLPVSTYPEYIYQSILNYEQIWRESARDRDRESCELMLTHLRPEGAKFPQPEEGDEVLPLMRPQAYDPVDGEEPGVRVTVEFWVSARHENPAHYVRDRVLRDTEVTYPDVSILDAWNEEGGDE